MLFCRVIPSYSDDWYIWESCKIVFQVQQAGLVWTVRKLGLVNEEKKLNLEKISFKLLKTNRRANKDSGKQKDTKHTCVGIRLAVFEHEKTTEGQTCIFISITVLN